MPNRNCPKWWTVCGSASRREVPQLLERWLDALDADGRWALLKLLTGGLRVGVSARLAKQALADLGGVEVSEIEEIWHSQHPPYEDLFAWLEKRSEKPNANAPRFRPVMLAQGIDDAEIFPNFDGRRRPTMRRNGNGRHPRPGGE